jgi:trk system potassium uptake protein TrkA
MKRQFAVIGLGRFGSAVALSLAEQHCHVIAIDHDESKVREIADHVTLAVQLDAMDKKALRGAGVQNVDVAIVSIGSNIEASILTVMILKELGIQEIIAKAVNDLHGKVLSQIGASNVIYPERDMAERVAQRLAGTRFIELIDLSPEYSIVEIPAPDFFWNKSVVETELRKNYNISIIAIRRREPNEKETWIINPLASEIIRKNDVLVLLGANQDIEKIR